MATFSIESIYNWYRQLVANPKYRWWVIGASLLYVLSPIDIAPDFIPFIGQVDDAVVITILATELASVLKDRMNTVKQKNNTKNSEINIPEVVDVTSTEI
jgi:uncharacterized membrane protein YkvA (DUF1232 family)